MKVVFISNFLNHHQLPFCEAMADKCNFYFIATQKFNYGKISEGYEDMNSKYPFVVRAYEGHYEFVQKIIQDADVVIFGEAPERYISDRIKSGKMVFRYLERPLKRGVEIHKYPYRFIKWHYQNHANRNVYLLCASAYAAKDYKLFRLYNNKCYKWGYFPRVIKYPNGIEEIIKKKQESSILWAGRHIELKHPELAIYVAKRLRDDGIDFTMNILGSGIMTSEIEELIIQNSLSEHVHLLGTKKVNEVREYMENSEIFLFTSDRNEGWGAVLNESMSSGCAVVANKSIGAVPYLVEEGIDGLTYQNGDADELYKKTRFLLEHVIERKKIATNAYNKLYGLWNADIAAERLLLLASDLMDSHYSTRFLDGPCSKEK